MFVCFLPKSNDFSAVIYNFDKVHDGDAMLLGTGNFGMLQGLRIHKPEDYLNYFFWLSSLNHRIKNAQLHAVISVPGKSRTSEELRKIAQQWLIEMDYGSQPYLIFFHSDTQNNHVHIVSSRVRKNGTVISNSFDRYKSVKAISRITGMDIEANILKDCHEALSYNFQSRLAFKQLMQRKRYYLSENDEGFNIYKYRRQVARVLFSELDLLISKNFVSPFHQQRINTILTSALKVYKGIVRPQYLPLSGQRRGRLVGYSSELSVHLQDNFGLETLYQTDKTGFVKDYFIIDPGYKLMLESAVLLSPEIFLGAESGNTEISAVEYPLSEPLKSRGQHILSAINFSISDDAHDASLYHKKKNRNN